MARVAVFDLDGTLADTAADLIAAANGALEAAGHGRPLDPAAHRAVAFADGRAMLRAGLALRGVPEAAAAQAVEAGYPVLLGLYAGGIHVETRLYPGVEAALDRLSAAGWRLAVCTNKPEGLAETLLRSLGLRHRFAAMLGADSRAWRKPDPRHLIETIALAGGAPDAAVLVGDTRTDRDAARAAGVPCVLVTFGPDGRAVEALGPEALLDAYEDLPGLLERLVPRGPIAT